MMMVLSFTNLFATVNILICSINMDVPFLVTSQDIPTISIDIPDENKHHIKFLLFSMMNLTLLFLLLQKINLITLLLLVILKLMIWKKN